MSDAMRKQLNPANAMSFIALMFATTGGAVAVTSHGGGGNGGGYTHATVAKKKSKSKSTGKPGPRGLAGPKGATGMTGPAGPAGPKGEAGLAGPKGEGGATGASGKDGESVISAALNPGEEGCAEGGSKFTVGGKTTTACNGENGEPGPQGPPGTTGFTKTLPAGETETGSWSTETRGTALSIGSIGFTLQLKTELSSEHVFFLVPGEEELVHCPGTAEVPRATAGNLCVYEAEVTGELAKGFIKFAGKPFGGGLGASKSGAVVLQAPPESASESALASSWGTWAVTAPEGP